MDKYHDELMFSVTCFVLSILLGILSFTSSVQSQPEMNERYNKSSVMLHSDGTFSHK